MGLILLEALLALFIFIAIVWWTMFSGRRKGELPQAQPVPAEPPRPTPDAVPSDAASHSPPTERR